MQTLRPSRRMDRQARRAVTLKHDNVWKMAVDGMHTLSVSMVVSQRQTAMMCVSK